MIGLPITKVVTITEVAQDEVVRMETSIDSQTASVDSENSLVFDTEPATDSLSIPLPNEQEAILLKREDYIEKIAYGIYNAIISSYEIYLTEDH